MEIGRLPRMTSSLALAAIPLILGDSNDSAFLNYFEASVPGSGDKATPQGSGQYLSYNPNLAGTECYSIN
jgi:hypothetical protein